MLALRQVFKIINISRSNFSVKNLSKMPKHTVYEHTDNVEHVENSHIDGNILLNHPRLKNSFWKHISPKKKHEIMIMAKICAQVAQMSNCNIVVDFGSGLGHLSRILAYGFGLKVCCLEAQEYLSEQAKKLDQQFEVTASKYLTPEQLNKLVRPVHINMTIKDTTDLDCVAEQVKIAFKLTNDNYKLGVVGLHPCGDLASILLRFFKLNGNVQFINVASCCYMKLTTDKAPIIGYPLSRFLGKQEHELCYVARELSCHAIEQYINRLKAGRYKELKIHAFRAALENIVVKYHPEKKHMGMRNVKCLNDLTFLEYCNKATYGIGIEIPEHDIQSHETLNNLLHWKNVMIFYSLRLMFAPMIETIILLDRFLYVAEPDVECRLIPVFDPKVSPRSHILIAMKHVTS